MIAGVLVLGREYWYSLPLVRILQEYWYYLPLVRIPQEYWYSGGSTGTLYLSTGYVTVRSAYCT